ncbi:hypothetical protein [Metasolibacillus meyeri]|uniref:hypothetical protein n=1 Tax=Metasolibacillus meyeri TaxID=1071052 RepID=UPI000D309327|nr:hypothetical protein [Metasolibacillus meyeri]
MYTIQQLQAADYLLKLITQDKETAFFKKNLKLVVFTMNNYWYGDFITLTGNKPSQSFINGSGVIEIVSFYSSGNTAEPFFKKIYDVYLNKSKSDVFRYNPFSRMEHNSLDLLFQMLMKMVYTAKISDDSPISPYLLNAYSLDGKLRLPFLNMPSQDIKAVSLFEAPVQD